MQVVFLDAREFTDKAASHEYLKEMFDFPEHYGKNLDALYDCLSDLEDVEVEILNMPEGKTYVSKIVSVMKDADVKVEVSE